MHLDFASQHSISDICMLPIFNSHQIADFIFKPGVFGGLELYGEDRAVTWTKLSVTAASGSTKLTLAEPVDWRKDEEIVIAPTGFSAWETETKKIVAVSNDNRTLTLNDTLKHTHKGKYSE